MNKTLWFEPATKKQETVRLQKSLKYALKEKWEGQINDILLLAKKKNIRLKTN